MHEDIAHRFEYHPPKTENVAGKHERVRRDLFIVAQNLQMVCPPGRELALAITKLEEAMMWANAAIARGQGG